jgi:putative ABC transport system ATP-binding protein
MTRPIIEAADVAASFGTGAGRVEALNGVSLTLGGGQLTLLVGPSGSGKTTLLSILGGMLTPTRGTVRIGGHATSAMSSGALARLRRNHVGFVFQTYHLFPTLSALDNVRLALDVRGEPSGSAIAKARCALSEVGLARKAAAFPHQLSGGEQQRVAIARAIVGDASAILADEPTGALDSDNGRAVMTILERIARDPGRCVLVVTHDPRSLPFAHRIIHIEDGRILGEEPGEAQRKAWPRISRGHPETRRRA